MARVTPAEVKVIIDINLNDDAVFLWINAANMIVNDNVECIGNDEDKLSQIELYLTAHFLSIRYPSAGGYVVKSEKAEDLQTTYATSQSNVARDINNTVYGQMANTLSGGCLADMNDESISLCSLGGGNNESE